MSLWWNLTSHWLFSFPSSGVSFGQMSCKKLLLVCFLVPGIALMIYLGHNPMTKSWLHDQVQREAKRPTTDYPNTEEDPGLYHVAYPRNYKFIIDQPGICEERKPYVVIIVPVPPQDFNARSEIRNTWAGKKVVGGKEVLVLFILGLHSGNDEETLQEQLRNESQQYKDLLQSNFQDSYRNLTIKTMMMMEWLSRECQQASYAVKVDADVLLNMNNLINMLVGLNTVPSNYMSGLVWNGSPVIRNPSNKFFLPHEVYPKNEYPPYPLGMCYIISLDLPQKFLQESKKIKPLYIEDVYLGMCLEQLGISPIKLSNMGQIVVNPPNYNRCYYSHLIAVLTDNTNQMASFWRDIHSTSRPCWAGNHTK